MENSWFPIANGMIQDENFRDLTPTEKLYFWKVLSEFNMSYGEFYKADIWFAASLNLSIEKIRKARAKLSKMGYITMVPGTQDKRGRKLATTYKDVKWADVVEKGQFSKMDRTTFERLISHIIDNHLSHADVVCYVYIHHLIWIKGGEYASLTKKEFAELTGMPKIMSNVKSLMANFKFSNGEMLFDFRDYYHNIKFEKIRTVLYTDEHEKMRLRKIEDHIVKLRAKSEKKERDKLRREGAVFPEDLYPLFKQLYQEKHNEDPGYEWRERELISLGKPEDVATAIQNYFKSPLPRGRRHYTLPAFLQGYKKYADGR